MHDAKLSFGFLTTYEETIFIQRTENFRFEISRPIKRTATVPFLTLRETFLAFIAYAREKGTRCPFSGMTDRKVLVSL